MSKRLNIALVAHDSRKQELLDWVTFNANKLCKDNLFATGTTATLFSQVTFKVRTHYEEGYLEEDRPLEVNSLLSGPLGGDQQIGAMIAEGKIDVLIFFCDNLITQGHQQDVSALVRLASLYNIAFATNRTTADLIITSPLIDDPHYMRVIPKAIETYKNRFKK